MKKLNLQAKKALNNCLSSIARAKGIHIDKNELLFIADKIAEVDAEKQITAGNIYEALQYRDLPQTIKDLKERAKNLPQYKNYKGTPFYKRIQEVFNI